MRSMSSRVGQEAAGLYVMPSFPARGGQGYRTASCNIRAWAFSPTSALHSLRPLTSLGGEVARRVRLARGGTLLRLGVEARLAAVVDLHAGRHALVGVQEQHVHLGAGVHAREARHTRVLLLGERRELLRRHAGQGRGTGRQREGGEQNESCRDAHHVLPPFVVSVARCADRKLANQNPMIPPKMPMYASAPISSAQKP